MAIPPVERSLGAHHSSLLVSQMTEVDLQKIENQGLRTFRNSLKEADVELDGPLSDEIKGALVTELEEHWRAQRRYTFLRTLQSHWNLTIPHKLVIPSAPISMPPKDRPDSFYNKATMLYFLPAGMPYSHAPSANFACIEKAWTASYNNEENIDLLRFFASQVSISGTGPQTVTDILRFHKFQCDLASKILSHIETNGPISHCGLDPTTHRVFSLCRAIVLIFDCSISPDSTAFAKRGYIDLDQYSRDQPVLMLRTGEESTLVAPISFEDIRAHELPVNREVCDFGDGQVIRVPLSTAIKFITDLQQKEDATHEQSYINDRALGPLPPDEESCEGPRPATAKQWAEEVIQLVEKHGIQISYAATSALVGVLLVRKGTVEPSPIPSSFFRSGARWR